MDCGNIIQINREHTQLLFCVCVCVILPVTGYLLNDITKEEEQHRNRWVK
jgi:hypothetical protein